MPVQLQTGCGFGNTITLDNGSLLSVYSYHHVDEDIAELLKSDRFKKEGRLQLLPQQSPRLD